MDSRKAEIDLMLKTAFPGLSREAVDLIHQKAEERDLYTAVAEVTGQPRSMIKAIFFGYSYGSLLRGF